MQTGELTPRRSPEWPQSVAHLRQHGLTAQEVDLERREAALTRIERAIALTPFPAEYFEPGRKSNAGDWWARQLASM